MKFYEKTFNNTKIYIAELNPAKGKLVVTYEKDLETIDNICHDYWHKRYGEAKFKINLSLFNYADGSRNGSMYVDKYSLIAPAQENDKYIEAVWQDNLLSIVDMMQSDHNSKYKDSDWYVGLPSLTYNGKKDRRKLSSIPTDKNPRTAFGQKKDGTIVMITTNNRPSGLTWDETADLMLKLDCLNSVMCDGGGSSSMQVDGKIVNNSGNRKIYDSLLFYSNENIEYLGDLGEIEYHKEEIVEYNEWYDLEELKQKEHILIVAKEFEGSFDGTTINSSYHPKGRMGCRIDCYLDSKLVYSTKNASTLPSSATANYGNLYNGGTNIPVIQEGIYTIFTKLHFGKHKAFEIKNINRGQDVPVIRRNSSNVDYLSTSTGINFHYRMPTDDRSGVASSTGCLTVLEDDLMEMFDILGIKSFNGDYVGKIIIDRSSIDDELYEHYRNDWYPNHMDKFAKQTKQETQEETKPEINNIDDIIEFAEIKKEYESLIEKVFNAGREYENI